MLQLHQTLAPKTLSGILMALLSACASIGSHDAVVNFEANEIIIEKSSIRDLPLSDLENIRVAVSGYIRPQRAGTPVMYLDKPTSYKSEPYKNCINIVASNKIKIRVWSKNLEKRNLSGYFFTLPRLSGEILHFKHKGIEFTPSCQYINNIDRYPYFFVTEVR